MAVREVMGLLALPLMTACHAGPSGTAPVSSPQATSNGDAAGANPGLKALLGKAVQNMRFVEGGTFQMGDFGPLHSPEKLYYSSETSNKPLHKVTLDSFSMSAYKTTYADHDVYSEVIGQDRVGQDSLTTKFYRRAEVAAGLNWRQARDYCQWLGRQLKLPMDLPTEAQWEYAARNRGQFFLYATDNGKAEPGRNVWEHDQIQNYYQEHHYRAPGPSLALGMFPPTPLGLYDMMTDGYEWTLDWFDAGYYAISPENNPKGPSNGKEKVIRSSPNRGGDGLAFGDGMSIARRHREPDPPKIDLLTGKPDSTKNMTPDTMARCVVNSPSPINTER